MLKLKVNQSIISTFQADKPRAEDCHAIRYSVTLSMTVEEHKELCKQLQSLMGFMIGSAFEAAQTLLEKEHDRTPSTHSGLISIDCWGEDQSFSGLILNGQIYPYMEENPERILIIQDTEVQLSCRVMTKKDKSIVFAWTCHSIDKIGLTPQESDGKKDKKR